MVPENKYEAAERFLSGLRPSTPRAQIYRGQADATWQLIPKAFRKDAKFPTPRGMRTVEEEAKAAQAQVEAGLRSGSSDHDVRLDLEVGTLIGFFQAADGAGLPLPEDSQVIRWQLFENYPRTGWPRREIRSILALAQHHGLPTRLLDWTWDWRVAAFFAARDVFRQPSRPDQLAVWSLDSGMLELEKGLERVGVRGRPQIERPYRLELVTAPSATNTYLRAQRGLFTLLEPKESSGLPPDTPVDELKVLGDGSNFLLRKSTLAAEAAPELLHILACEGVNSAAVFPDFQGVVWSLEEPWHWMV